VKRLFALLVGITFIAATTGLAAAATTTDKKPAADTKMSDKKDASAKKGATKTATGTVKSASPDSIVVAGKDKGKDAEWTFAVDDKTKVKKAGKDTMAKDLAAGDRVTVRYMDHDGKATAMNVNVSAAKKAETKAETKPAEEK
jgi:ribosomal protein S1